MYDEHARLGATFTDFGGWTMPLRYSSELAEHRAVRTAAGLFDLSHMGEVAVVGPHAGAFLDYALVGKLSAVAVGKAKYSLICTPEGGIIDDLITYRLAEDDYLVVPNAGNAAVVGAALTERARGFDVEVRDATATHLARRRPRPGFSGDPARGGAVEQAERVGSLRYYAATPAVVAGCDALVARTGYTGEDGFEVFTPNADVVAVWQALLAAGTPHGLVPAGLAARDSLRLEAGMPLYGNELRLDVDPFAAGLGGLVALTSKDGDFVGRDALVAARAEHEAQAPGRRVLVGLRGLARRAARSHQQVLVDGIVVGEVTSGAPSPTLGYPVALAYVDPDVRRGRHPGAGRRTRAAAALRGRRPPFYRRPS